MPEKRKSCELAHSCMELDDMVKAMLRAGTSGPDSSIPLRPAVTVPEFPTHCLFRRRASLLVYLAPPTPDHPLSLPHNPRENRASEMRTGPTREFGRHLLPVALKKCEKFI
uniref:Uncharacterized protein n=1 Tax=Timema cristinae TaxID=61476 RepID=A0A7R9GNV2_TIMCR|nr:unnamed protein product [Timema cristinae]